MKRRGEDWRPVLLVIGSSGYALAAFCVAAVALAYVVTFAIMARSFLDQSKLELLLFGSALAFVGILTLPAIVYGIMLLFGHTPSRPIPKQLAPWETVGLILTGVGCALLAGNLATKTEWSWSIPVFFVLAAAIPVTLMIRIAIGGLPGGSRLRIWGSLGTGLWVATTLAMVAEVLAMVIAAMALGLYFVMEPERLSEVGRLAMQLRLGGGQEVSQSLLTTLMHIPWVVAVVLSLVCGAIPIIEELAKSVAVWLMWDQLSGPVHGFVIGALSGGGFAVMETLLGTMQPSPAWSLPLLMRWGTAAMHVLATAAAGWGIAATRARREWHWAPLAILFGMALHSLWNLSALFFGVGLSRLGGNPLSYRGAIPTQTLAGAGLMMSVTAAVIIALVATNRALRQQHPVGEGSMTEERLPNNRRQWPLPGQDKL